MIDERMTPTPEYLDARILCTIHARPPPPKLTGAEPRRCPDDGSRGIVEPADDLHRQRLVNRGLALPWVTVLEEAARGAAQVEPGSAQVTLPDLAPGHRHRHGCAGAPARGVGRDGGCG